MFANIIICFTLVWLLMLVCTTDVFAQPVVELIYTEPYYNKYLYSFKIHSGNESLGPYQIQLESNLETIIMDRDEIIEPNSWVQWFIYIRANDPNSITVNVDSIQK